MKKLFFLIALIFVFGCGSRKVNKNKHSLIEENQTSIKDQTKITEIEFERKKLWELIYRLNFKADNITIHPDGRVDISQPVVESETKETKQDEEKQKEIEIESKITFDQTEKKEEKSQNKNVDKKQFSRIDLLLVSVCVIFLAYKIYRKIKK